MSFLLDSDQRGHISINSLGHKELSEFVITLDEKAFRATQIYEWLHSSKLDKRVSSFEEMTNLSKAFRAKLSEHSSIYRINEIAKTVSTVDGSIKVLLNLVDGERIESVLLRDGDRATACISTQVGCRMGCKFCATAAIGFKRDLTTAEIVEQVRILEEICLESDITPEGRLTNIVVMGMGEPLDNFDNLFYALEILMSKYGYGYGHKRITVSTSGITSKIPELLDMEYPVNIAISMNAPNQEIRSEIMPISNRYNLSSLLRCIRELPLGKRETVTLEYVLIGGVNDSIENAKEFADRVKQLPVKVNLIIYNGGGDESFVPPTEKSVLAFQNILLANDISTFIRKSLGSDILGACGQLAAGYENKRER